LRQVPGKGKQKSCRIELGRNTEYTGRQLQTGSSGFQRFTDQTIANDDIGYDDCNDIGEDLLKENCATVQPVHCEVYWHPPFRRDDTHVSDRSKLDPRTHKGPRNVSNFSTRVFLSSYYRLEWKIILLNIFNISKSLFIRNNGV
jgi:hypothetical protein